jgi:stage II sporulation protein D
VIGPGGGATLDSSTHGGPLRLNAGSAVRIRLVGSRLAVTFDDSSRGQVHATSVRIRADDGSRLTLSIPGKITRQVEGELAVVLGPRGRRRCLVPILTVDRELAVASVVAAELSGEKSREAAKALAVVARTFMIAHSGRHARDGYDFCDTTHCQLYRGLDDLSTAATGLDIEAAVAATADEYLSFSGRVLEGYYTAVCGGLSATPEMVWGGTPASGYHYRRTRCDWCRGSPFFGWQRTAKANAVLQAISIAIGRSVPDGAEISVETRAPDGFVYRVVIRDAAGVRELSADRFRTAIGRQLGWDTVLSPSFTIERRGEVYIFRGNGLGSKVGLCLAGALAQSAGGHGYVEILSYYYPDARLEHGP